MKISTLFATPPKPAPTIGDNIAKMKERIEDAVSVAIDARIHHSEIVQALESQINRVPSALRHHRGDLVIADPRLGASGVISIGLFNLHYDTVRKFLFIGAPEFFR